MRGSKTTGTSMALAAPVGQGGGGEPDGAMILPAGAVAPGPMRGATIDELTARRLRDSRSPGRARAQRLNAAAGLGALVQAKR